MVVSTISNRRLNNLITQLQRDFTEVSFKKAAKDYWSPRTKTIFYNPALPVQEASFGLLHELSHSILDHQTYGTDFELLQMESEAWGLAAKLGKKYGVNISSQHIQKCLNTYRDWLYHRSLCPECGTQAIQSDERTYKCFNCQTHWQVSTSRFSRPYRQINR